MARKYLIETFGCQMNFHDSERMAGLLEQAGFESTDDAVDADVVVINTCGFIDNAKQESIDTILDFAAAKKAKVQPSSDLAKEAQLFSGIGPA